MGAMSHLDRFPVDTPRHTKINSLILYFFSFVGSSARIFRSDRAIELQLFIEDFEAVGEHEKLIFVRNIILWVNS